MAVKINPLTGEFDYVSDASASGVEWQDIEGKPSTFTPAEHDNTKHSTAYASTAELTAVSGVLQNQITNIDVAWEDIDDKPSTFPPSNHTHTEDEISDLGDYVTTSELTTTSGHFQDIVDNLPTDYVTSFIDLDDVPAEYTGQENKYLRVNSGATGLEFATVSGGTGTSDHGELTGLSDDDHPQYLLVTDFTTYSGAIVDQIPTDYITEAELTTASGNIVEQIPTDFYTTDEVDTLVSGVQSEITATSGTLQASIESIDLSDYYTKSEVDTISGTIVVQIPAPITDYITEAELTTASGNIVSQIPSLTGYATESYVDTVSGTLHDEMGSIDLSDYYTKEEVNTISGAIDDSIPVITEYPSGVATISGSADSVSIVFEEELDDASYEVVCSMENTTDLTPSTFTYFINAKSTTGFTVKLSGNTDTSNYKLNWRVGAVAVLGDNGVTDHALLSHLAFADSGHSGFSASDHVHDYASNDDLTALSGTIVSALANKSDTTHDHDDDYLSLDGGTITQNLIILGDLSVSGTQYTTNQETLAIESNYIVVNDGEAGAGVTAGDAGLQVDRGSENDYFFAFDESTDTFRVGISGSLQAVATREDTPTDQYIPVWLSATNSFSTTSGIAKSSVMTSLSMDANPTLGGNLVLDGYCVDYGSILTVSGTKRGDIMTVQVDDSNSDFAKVLYQGADFNYDLADCDATATSPACVMATQAGSGSKVVMKRGQICFGGWNWSAGKLYLSGTAGVMTQTKPSTTGQQIQVLGHALSSTTIWFEPELLIAEVA